MKVIYKSEEEGERERGGKKGKEDRNLS